MPFSPGLGDIPLDQVVVFEQPLETRHRRDPGEVQPLCGPSGVDESARDGAVEIDAVGFFQSLQYRNPYNEHEDT